MGSASPQAPGTQRGPRSPEVAPPTPEPRCPSPPDAIASLLSFSLQNLSINSGNDSNDQ